MLVRQPDLLLLDEPTNHLDLAAIERLEAFLVRVPRRLRAGLARPRVHPRRLPRDRRAGGRQVRPLPVRLRQVRRRARRAPRARPRRVRAAEGARRQDRGLHPPQPGRAEDQAGAEPAQDAGEAGAARAPRGQRGSTPGKIALRLPDRRRPRQQGDHPRAPPHRRLPGRDAHPARRDRQHLPRRQGRHRRPERQRQVDAAQDADRRAAAARGRGRDAAPGCASATSIRSWARSTRTCR